VVNVIYLYIPFYNQRKSVIQSLPSQLGTPHEACSKSLYNH
ncbi:unnamed protein product, partial [Heterotrigona itama]